MEASGTTTPPQTPPEATQGASEPGASSQGTSSAEGLTAPGTEAHTRPEGDDERDESGRYLSREAASYRRRLREAESERDDLRARLERYERAEVERLASANGLAVPGDVWQFGAQLEHLRSEEGIDAETVQGLVTDILRSRPGLQAARAGCIGIGQGAAARPSRQPAVGLSALLKPGH